MAKTGKKSAKARSSRSGSSSRKTGDLTLRGKRPSDIKGGRAKLNTVG